MDTNNFYQAIKIARDNASMDLEASNKLLAIINELVESAENESLNDEEVSKLSNKILEVALKLTDESKKLNSAINKLAGL